MENFGCGNGGWTPVMKIDGIKVCFLLKSRTNVLGLEKFSFTRVQQISSISFRPMPVGTTFSTVGGVESQRTKKAI